MGSQGGTQGSRGGAEKDPTRRILIGALGRAHGTPHRIPMGSQGVHGEPMGPPERPQGVQKGSDVYIDFGRPMEPTKHGTQREAWSPIGHKFCFFAAGARSP